MKSIWLSSERGEEAITKVSFRRSDFAVIPSLSFHASEARHGIQYFQQILDTRFRGYDAVAGVFPHYDTVSKAGIQERPGAVFMCVVIRFVESFDLIGE